MDESRDAATLADLIEACERIVTYTRGVEERAFYQDSLLYDAVIRQVSILGEAVKRLSAGLRSRHPDVPWQNIAGMRDRLIHDYDDIDPAEVWRTSRVDVPEPVQHLRVIQRDLKD
jgi:uncharacterized protein with HEPN domain